MMLLFGFLIIQNEHECRREQMTEASSARYRNHSEIYYSCMNAVHWYTHIIIDIDIDNNANAIFIIVFCSSKKNMKEQKGKVIFSDSSTESHQQDYGRTRYSNPFAPLFGFSLKRDEMCSRPEHAI